MDELKDMIALLKRADFDPTVIDTDLHKRVADAIQDWFIRRFDMRVNSRDGDQGLSMWMRDVEEVVREIMRDERFKDPVQECNECRMLPVEYAQALFSQNEPSGYPMLSLVIYVYHGISWDIPG